MADRKSNLESPGARKHVIVAGYGPVGRAVTEQLELVGFAVTVVDLNADTVNRQQALHSRCVCGDVTDPEVLKQAGIHDAGALIVTIPNEQAAVKACQLARKLSPKIFIAARTNHLSRGMLATEAGADYVVIEEIVTAEAMRRAVIERLLDGWSR